MEGEEVSEREREGGAEKNKMDTINCRDREIK